MANHATLERALALWRSGDRRVRRPMAPPQRAAAERALAAAVAHLGRADTIEALLAAYFDGPVAPREDWLPDGCPSHPGWLPDLAAVEDAAYWPRAQQLLHGAPPGHATTEKLADWAPCQAGYAQAISR